MNQKLSDNRLQRQLFKFAPGLFFVGLVVLWEAFCRLLYCRHLPQL